MAISVQTFIHTSIDTVWSAYTTPSDIRQWNAASDDWHTTEVTVDLRAGGGFASRMEAKDGSVGFDFVGTYSKVVEHELIEFSFSERTASVQFIRHLDGVTVRVTFDPETENSHEEQRQGWQAILDNFAKYVEARS